jgi:hypothetical protein
MVTKNENILFLLFNIFSIPIRHCWLLRKLRERDSYQEREHSFIIIKHIFPSYRALLEQLNKLGKKAEEANLTLGNFEKAKRKGWLPRARIFFYYYLTYFLFLQGSASPVERVG